MVRKARKKPIEVQAIHYNHNIILDEFLKLLRSNESESIVMMSLLKLFIFKKNVEKLL